MRIRSLTSMVSIPPPVRTPRSVIERLHSEAARAITSPELRERIARDGAVAVGGTPREFDALIAAEFKRFGDVIRKAGILVDE